MKIFMFVFVTFLIASAIGQYENTSFYFSIENLSKEEPFDSFDEEEIGFYSINEERRRHLIVDKDSISVRSGFEIIIPKKTAIQKGFTFKDDKMYGMEPYNGIHYTEVNDTIIALYFQFDHYLGKEDFVISGKNGYYVFTQEHNDYYSCEYITFGSEGITIYSIDHGKIMKTIQKITDVKKAPDTKIDTYIAQPTLKELEALVKKDCFNDLRSYPMVEHL